MLKVEQLSKRLGDFTIRNVSFEVAQGEYFVLLGASGVGKTVLLETITGILAVDSGSVKLNGRDITYEKIQKRDIGLVYQDQALFPHLTVRQNIAYGLNARNHKRAEINSRVNALAGEVEVTHLLERKPTTLSGGEAQRVALARALAMQPKCLLLDEPLSSLDIGSRSEMRALLRRINRKQITMIHVTHDYEEAISLAMRVGIMENGRIVQVDTPQQIFMHPKSEFVARFIGIRNFFLGELCKETPGSGTSAAFNTSGLQFSVLTDEEPGEGNAIIRSQDVTISKESSSSSARNEFEGTIIDIANARLGIEVIVDIGVEIAALITQDSVRTLDLEFGKKVFVSFKASAVKFIKA